MNIVIDPNSPVRLVSEAAQGSEEVTGSVGEVTCAQQTPVNDIDATHRIAILVEAGQIEVNQAIDQILEKICTGPMLRGCSQELRSEVTAALRMLLDTDPYLQSLITVVER